MLEQNTQRYVDRITIIIVTQHYNVSFIIDILRAECFVSRFYYFLPSRRTNIFPSVSDTLKRIICSCIRKIQASPTRKSRRRRDVPLMRSSTRLFHRNGCSINKGKFKTFNNSLTVS